jgi:hypothetical protein
VIKGKTSELIALLVSTFLLRIGFAASLILFDWQLIWGIESTLGLDAVSEFGPIFLTAFASKPIILFATLGASVVLLLYSPASLLLDSVKNSQGAYTSLLVMVMYIALIHFLHGIVASAKVSPTLGYINHFSTDHNRALRMAYYDNAVLYGRAVGMPFGGLLWFWLGVEEDGISVHEQAKRIAWIYPILSSLVSETHLNIKMYIHFR